MNKINMYENSFSRITIKYIGSNNNFTQMTKINMFKNNFSHINNVNVCKNSFNHITKMHMFK